ncbi:hypothetical protein [Bizionia echini]|uniref:DUF4870 domain-containing protein n=1 Tax=Bizionia echini TaxID=649333 RepID=UPI0030D8D3DF
MTDQTIQEGKTMAIVAYFTFIGLIIAIVMNIDKKNQFTTFHIRQMLGLVIMLLISNITEKYISSWLGTSFWAITFVCWLFGLFYAIKSEMKPIPIIGEKFQEWFRNIN